MIGCLRTRICKQPIIALYFESENVLKLYNLEARLIRVYLSWLRTEKKLAKSRLKFTTHVPHFQSSVEATDLYQSDL